MSGKGLGQPNLGKQLPTIGTGGTREIGDLRVNRLEPGNGRDDDREKRQQEHDQQLGRVAKAEPDDEQRRDRDLGHDLQKHHHRVHRVLHEARIGDRQRERNAHHHRQQITAQNLLRGNPGTIHHHRNTLVEFQPDLAGGGQQVLFDAEQAYRHLPKQQKAHRQQQSALPLAPPAGERTHGRGGCR
jgi:hypothetical protein